MRIKPKVFWFLIDVIILTMVLTIAVYGVIKEQSLVILFYVPHFAGYVAWPGSLLLFSGFMALLMAKGFVKEAPFITVFTAAFYDSSISLLDLVPLIANYLDWSVMMALPLFIFRKAIKVPWALLAVWPPLLLYIRFYFPIPNSDYPIRILLESFSCVISSRIFKPLLRRKADA